MAKPKTNKQAVKRVPETGLKVCYDEYCEVTREAVRDEWDRDDTASTWSVGGLRLTEDYPDVSACFPIKAGDIVYLLYVVYSTGDSFGHSEDGSISFVDVFKTHAKAVTAANTIREHSNWYCQLHPRYQ